MKRQCPPCDQLCRQGRDCPAEAPQRLGFDDQSRPASKAVTFALTAICLIGCLCWAAAIYFFWR